METGMYDDDKVPALEVASHAATVSDQLLTTDARDSIAERSAQQTNALLGGSTKPLKKTGVSIDVGARYEVIKVTSPFGEGDVIKVVSMSAHGYLAIRTRDGVKGEISGDPSQIRPVKDYKASTVGVEQELMRYKVRLATNAASVIGRVTANNETLVEFTRDIGRADGQWGEYTIELRTTPAERTDDAALERRLAATRYILDAIKRARNGGAVESQKANGLAIDILNPSHTIYGDGEPAFANQVSLGVPTDELFESPLSPENKAIFTNAWWIDWSYAKDIQLATPAATNVYVALASVIAFVEQTVKLAFPKGATSIKVDMTNPKVKDRWEVLPRTPPWEWLDCLAKREREKVTERLEKKFSNNALRKAAFTYIRTKQNLAGHPVPQATIDGKHSSVFEFRTVPRELQGHLHGDAQGAKEDTTPKDTKPVGPAPDWMTNNPLRKQRPSKEEED